jgi:hypothetical protein
LLGHTRYCAAQTFEALFLIHAMRCICESVYRGVDDARVARHRTHARRTLDYLLFGPPWQRIPSDWQPDLSNPTIFYQGPRQAIAVSLNDDRATPVFSDVQRWGPNYMPPDGLGGGVEIITIWPALSYVAQWTEGSAGKGLENTYMKRALDCWVPRASHDELLRAFADEASDPARDNSANWMGLAARLQALGVR